MAKAVFVKFRKINSVKNNIKYLKSTKEHPETCIHYSTCDNKLWFEYAEKNQEEYIRSGQKGKCVEAREMILVFPNEFYNLDPVLRQEILNRTAEEFKKENDVEVFAALHAADKDANNMHIHLMYMERRQIKEKEQIATRKTWIEKATGKKLRTKKEAYIDGRLKDGVIEYQKGEAIKSSKWSTKDKYLKSNDFTHQVKKKWAEKLNEYSKDLKLEADERRVFNGKKNFLFGMSPLRRAKKYRNKEKQKRSEEHCENFNKNIRKTNEQKIRYNRLVIEAVELKILTPVTAFHKKDWMLQDIRKLCLEKKKQEITGYIKSKADELEEMIAQKRQNEFLKKGIGEALKEFEEETNIYQTGILEKIASAENRTGQQKIFPDKKEIGR